MKICPVCKNKYDDSLSFCPRDTEVLKEDRESLVGTILDGQYEIEAFIAEGGMGAVYRARHTMLGDKVAIKFLPREMRRSPEWLKRFQREGQAARRFRHPNAVVVHDMRMSSEGDIYLVMEYVEGRTLDQIVAAFGGKLLPTASIRVIEQVAEVLDAAHQTGVVHRDMKPSNIMVADEGGIVKLMDLGVAKILDTPDDDGELTTAGQFIGTPPYMSPEQWGEIPRDGGHEIDGRTDIYSLGVMTYQITAGEQPFKGTGVLEYRRAHCKEVAPELSTIVENLPPGWSQAVARAMQKDRADRFETAREFADALRASVINSGLLPIELLARNANETLEFAAPTTVRNSKNQTKISEDQKYQKTQPDILIVWKLWICSRRTKSSWTK
jgi:eukaryotic-like serine/threonine-protein kinase